MGGFTSVNLARSSATVVTMDPWLIKLPSPADVTVAVFVPVESFAQIAARQLHWSGVCGSATWDGGLLVVH